MILRSSFFCSAFFIFAIVFLINFMLQYVDRLFFKEAHILTLKELQIGKSATILSVGGEGELRQHLLDMGLIPDAKVTMVKYAPMGDPVEVLLS